MNHMPVVAQIFFFGALISAIMSTASATLLSSADYTREFLENNEGIIMRRYLVDRTATQEFYEIKTLDNPNDVITYVTELSGAEDLMLMDGGTF
jgi:hypothetical protein